MLAPLEEMFGFFVKGEIIEGGLWCRSIQDPGGRFRADRGHRLVHGGCGGLLIHSQPQGQGDCYLAARHHPQTTQPRWVVTPLVTHRVQCSKMLRPVWRRVEICARFLFAASCGSSLSSSGLSDTLKYCREGIQKDCKHNTDRFPVHMPCHEVCHDASSCNLLFPMTKASDDQRC